MDAVTMVVFVALIYPAGRLLSAEGRSFKVWAWIAVFIGPLAFRWCSCFRNLRRGTSATPEGRNAKSVERTGGIEPGSVLVLRGFGKGGHPAWSGWMGALRQSVGWTAPCMLQRQQHSTREAENSMPIVNRVADLQPDIQAWRRDIHEHPELLYDVHRTAAFVADRLREFGCDEVATGLGQTGVVGVIKGKKPAGKGDLKVIGLRADMDALPIEEATNLPYASKTPGKMHACGHDGHTAMLLGAARYLAETRNFAGDAVVIFQPAEEGGAGAAAMIKDGLMDRFGIEQVYGMHNGPGIPVGSFAIRSGPIMAATDELDIKITGLGGHAARPHICIDSVLVGAQVVTALQSIVSRSIDPLESAVISVCEFHAGNARNVIPQTAELRGTIRTLTPEVRAAGREAGARGGRRRGADHRRQDRPASTSAAIPSPSTTPRKPSSRRASPGKSPARPMCTRRRR